VSTGKSLAAAGLEQQKKKDIGCCRPRAAEKEVWRPRDAENQVYWLLLAQ
jgi:hypothetical protein